MTKPTYTGPAHPIGYVEFQRAFLGPTDGTLVPELMREVREEAARTSPGLVQWNARIDGPIYDGAGVPHYTLYVGFAPPVPSSEPLDPHNMNDAPPVQSGWPEPTDGITPLGTKERKF
jgi:hypothetical protein